MGLPNDAIPPVVLLLGAIALTMALRNVGPFAWIISPFYRYGILGLAIALTATYSATVLPGPMSSVHPFG
jgi:hypothetical protein